MVLPYVIALHHHRLPSTECATVNDSAQPFILLSLSLFGIRLSTVFIVAGSVAKQSLLSLL